MTMKIREAFFLRCYGAALHLYPKKFRERYGAQMMDAVRLDRARSANDFFLGLSLAWDGGRAAIGEHLREASLVRPGYAALFATFFTFLLLVASVTFQNVLRIGADRQPQRLTSSVRRQIAQGSSGTDFLGGLKMELSSKAWLESSTPFAVVYDSSGAAVTGNATLRGLLPQPPSGIFAQIRAKGTDKVTWQPAADLRIALVGQRLPDGGYVLAGQSLIVSEKREIEFHRLLIWMWVAMLAGVALSLAFGWRRTDRDGLARG
ncbi:hypothetical protein [Granulicella sibirica]|uniref:Uncharacterized protein n=1 Tax=Granulicella sibirica TaxID=2479048 RepID=A0A4Q0T9N6_9BACT|nr:hypothetical protein [Granulicella sibirica]RXH58769.1 hypothetical protein GRAN_2079 [Granulicella sibirica]